MSYVTERYRRRTGSYPTPRGPASRVWDGTWPASALPTRPQSSSNAKSWPRDGFRWPIEQAVASNAFGIDDMQTRCCSVYIQACYAAV